MLALGAGTTLLVAQPGLARPAAALDREGLCERAASLAWSSAVRGWHGQGPGAAEEGLAEAAWVAARAFCLVARGKRREKIERNVFFL